MPIYEYQCSECGLYFERLQKFGAPSPETCPNGHRQVQRLLSQPTIIFKGSGFYVTDNGRSSRVVASQNGQPRKNGKPATNAEPAEKTGPKTEEKPKS